MRIFSCVLMLCWTLLVVDVSHGGDANSHRAARGRAKNYRVTWQPSSTCAPGVAPSCAAPVVPLVGHPVAPSEVSLSAETTAQVAAEIAEDGKQLEGVWQRFEQLPNGGQLRMEKTIKDHRESLKTFSPNGTLLREQTAEIALSRSGDLRVIKWSHAQVTAGPDIGDKIDDGTMVYVFKGGQWVSVIGLVGSEKWGVYTEAWTRVPPSEPSK